jgi:glycosyltransferase involved in cell wall biosynthesis
MKFGVYNEPAGGAAGGSECCAAVLAEALARFGPVEIVHHRPGLTHDRLAELSGTDLGKVGLRYVEPEPAPAGLSRRPWKRLRQAAAWHAALSEPYDVFVNFTHGLPPFCRARHGILVVLFPLFNRFGPPAGPKASLVGRLRRRLGRVYDRWEWRRRIATYQHRMAISQFASRWARRWWGLDCRVVYPPVDTDFRTTDKAPAILSVGRFATEGHSKKQLEMVTAFRELAAGPLSGWEYFCAGGLSELPGDREYFEKVARVGQGCGAPVLANVGRPALKQLFERARLFWHATGFGEDEDRHPERAEHFGIATVEAMAAGCVPVVVNRGAQPEIVQHGVSGFVWDTPEELKAYTLRLAGDEGLWARLSAAARARARQFSRQAFVDSFLQALRLTLP